MPKVILSTEYVISIHAPPRGATVQKLLRILGIEFQFTPLREGRLAAEAATVRPYYFNSRPSARGDGEAQTVIEAQAISIHAPPRGATGRVHTRQTVHDDFNSRPSARGDEFLVQHYIRITYFNSRPSARGDLRGIGTHKKDYDFNSRPSARGDPRNQAD